MNKKQQEVYRNRVRDNVQTIIPTPLQRSMKHLAELEVYGSLVGVIYLLCLLYWNTTVAATQSPGLYKQALGKHSFYVLVAAVNFVLAKVLASAESERCLGRCMIWINYTLVMLACLVAFILWYLCWGGLGWTSDHLVSAFCVLVIRSWECFGVRSFAYELEIYEDRLSARLGIYDVGYRPGTYDEYLILRYIHAQIWYTAKVNQLKLKMDSLWTRNWSDLRLRMFGFRMLGQLLRMANQVIHLFIEWFAHLVTSRNNNKADAQLAL